MILLPACFIYLVTVADNLRKPIETFEMDSFGAASVGLAVLELLAEHMLKVSMHVMKG